MSPQDTNPPPPILTRLAAGEPRAMNECIDRFGGLVWSIVKGSVSNATDAEDLVQQIFTEVWKKAGAYSPAAASETTFIALVARRRMIDHLRKTGRQPEIEPIEAAAYVPAAEADGAAGSCDAEAVRASLANLPADTRHLFQLFFEQGCSHPEIAGKTGLPLGTVKTRLRRGLLILREQLLRAEQILSQPIP